MGATDFYTTGRGEDLNDAYDEAVRRAVDEYGHDPYNGTISTTDGAVLATRATLTSKGASLYAQAHLDDAQKWGPALAVGFAADDAFTFAKEKITVTLEDGDDQSWSPQYDLEDKARRVAFARWGERVHAVEVKARVRTKVVTTLAAGKSVLKWQAGAFKLFDTKTEALRYAREKTAGRQGTIGVKQVRVWPDSTFGDKTLAAEVTEVAVKATAEVTVTIATPKKVGAPVEGWLFFGLAAC